MPKYVVAGFGWGLGCMPALSVIHSATEALLAVCGASLFYFFLLHTDIRKRNKTCLSTAALHFVCVCCVEMSLKMPKTTAIMSDCTTPKHNRRCAQKHYQTLLNFVRYAQKHEQSNILASFWSHRVHTTVYYTDQVHLPIVDVVPRVNQRLHEYNSVNRGVSIVC